ncbi:hemagglutination activity domain protein [Leptolyngbya sp. Heron Island J]|uniref:CHAT domain-containing protein n=1 Tax=Leptolyngbya sp. Heron Island J TaxID=1385935 RepID=UPI0003B9CC47|nr:CHAT domain-containing protein [Leptolyngbya sp. Heron Island J]ESA36996.1 hemagglutination activity domain protein [Leptolyngbya sp. Heron Island J]
MGHSGWQRLNTLQLAGCLGIFALGIAPAWGQITPTGATSTTTKGFQIQVTDGIQSTDEINLFHQFENFNVQPDQTVIFMASDPVQNILGQVTGGQASIIDGGLAVSNNANLWLLNSAGILFGPDAHLNLQGDFTAATADAIGFEQGWLADGANYQALVGAPQSLAFISSPAHLVNLGDLQVDPGQRLSLLGGSVINAGTLVAPAGTITVAAVADNSRVQLSLTNQILTLDLEPWTTSGWETDITPVSLPALLTGSRFADANTLILETDGTVRLTQTETITPAAGHVAITGTINSAGDQGGQIAILGDQTSLVNADIRADGINQGGQIYVGGNYQGRGPLPNASQTRVNSGSELSANALQQGNGGQIIVWADDVTHFSGSAYAEGGSLNGNGGLIEISGKSHLGFDGQFSLSAPQGESGSILFDPDNIRIVSDGTPAEVATESLLLPDISAIDNDFGTLTLHANTLESWDGDDNIIFQANTNIEIDLGGNNELTFQPGTGSITFIADANNNFIGSFFMSGADDLLKTSGRDINISGTTITLQSIDADSATGAGDVNLTAPLLTSIAGSLNAENITVRSNELNLNGGNNSIIGTTLSIEPDNPATAINLGPGTNTLFDLDLLETDISALKDGFTHIAIGRSDGTGTITLHDSVTDRGATPFQDPVNILGANSLRGPEQVTDWTVTANNQGNLDRLFSNGLSFENVDSIVVSNGTNDTLQGADGDDIATFSGVDAGTFNGINFAGIQTINGAGGNDQFIFGNGAVINGSLDGGTGNNTLDYSAYITDITIDLATGSAPGTGGISNIHHVIAGSGANTLQGTAANDVVTLTDVGAGILNGTAFEGFETILPGDGDDRFIVNGGTWTNLDGGAGTDTLDYSASAVGVTIDVENQTANNVAGFVSIEDFWGGNGADILLGTSGNDAIAITGNNTGTLSNKTFANIETVDARAGNDTFSLNNGASVTGTLIGGDGFDTVDYSTYTSDITVDLQTNSTTNITSFNTLESFIGGSGNDNFKLDGTASIASIDGGAGNNTLIGDNIASIWHLTASNTGHGPGIDNFINIQSLVAGNQADQINSLANDAGFTGTVDGGMGPLTFRGDRINLGTAITGSGELIIAPSSTSRDIQLGGADVSAALTLSTTELASISAGFTSITIGHAESSGTITLEADVTLPSPTTLSSPQAEGSIDTQGFNLSAPELILSAAQDITTARLTAPAGIKINSGGAVSTQDILTNTALDGGDLVINAATTITTQQIDTTGITGVGGDVTLQSADTIQVHTVRAEGGPAGGNVDITTDQFFRALHSFTNLDGYNASISTAATNGTGAITIRHGGNSTVPFQVVDSSVLGSTAGLASGDFYIPAENFFLNSYTLGNIALLTQDIIAPPSVTPPPTATSPIISNPPTAALPAVVINPSVGTDVPAVGHIRLPLLGSHSHSLDESGALAGTNHDNSTLFEQLENSFSDQFKSHLNLYERVSISSVSLASATKILEDVEDVMGIKPGVLYVYFLVPDQAETALPEANELNPEDELGLLLLTPTGETIRRKVEGVTRSEVMAVAEAFYTQVTNSISAPSQYLPLAQQLYTWLITPVEAELQQYGINSLALAMDTGLRTLPVAALHNGTEYLVERYSLGVIPSLSLTDFAPDKFLYSQLESTQLLAMGASQFPSQRILPAVPEELKVVTQAFDDSKVFLNERFTLGNLRSQITQSNYGIIHLASHGVFEPGEPDNSYIQLWDQPLQLDQVHRLGLQDANIALMVLSACNTALGDREAEYGFAGLAVNAGVQTSVASLWPISDEGTLGLMTYFYQHLQQQSVRATALRQAQLAMLQGDLQFANGTLYGTDGQVLAHFPELENHGRWNFTHPFYWSTYTLVGSPW